MSEYNWQKPEQLPEERKQEYIRLIKKSNKVAQIVVFIMMLCIEFPMAVITIIDFNIWLFLTMMIIFIGTCLLLFKSKRERIRLLKDVKENQFEFFIEEARHIDEYNHINNRNNNHYGSVSLTNDVLFMKTEHSQKFSSFTWNSEDKTKSRTEEIDWHLSIELDKPDILKLEEYLKTALEKADGIYIPEKKMHFSAKAYQDKTISFGKKTAFWYYEDSEKREKIFPKSFQWAFSVAEGVRYVTVSDGEDSSVEVRNIYASGLNCMLGYIYVNAGEPVILIRDLTTDQIKAWSLKFE